MIFRGKDNVMIDSFKAFMMVEFEMTNLGLRWYNQ